MFKRFVDNKNIQLLIKKNSSSFFQRSYGLTTLRIIYGVVAIFAMLLLSIQASTGVIHADISKATIDNLAVSLMFIAGILGVLSLFFIYCIYRFKNIIEAVDFQNMLFSSAMRENADYSILLTNANEVVYMDSLAQKLFADRIQNGYHNFSLSELFSSEEDSNKKISVLSAIENNKSCTIDHTVDGKNFAAVLEPLKFAQGFFIIKGSSC